jgi:hypothetical protein
MSPLNTKLPWLLAGAPILAAIYAGCGGSGPGYNAFKGSDGGNGGFSNSSSSSGSTSSGSTSSGSASNSGDDSAVDDGATSNGGD